MFLFLQFVSQGEHSLVIHEHTTYVCKGVSLCTSNPAGEGFWPEPHMHIRGSLSV